MGGYILMKFLTISKLPSLLTETIINLPFSPTVVLIGIFILYLLLGMFLDIFSAVIITVPILFPVITGLGFDPIWFGVIVVIMIQIGLVSPPVGLDIFTLGGVIDVPLYTIFKGVLPFFIGMAICIILLIIFPQIVLFLPNMM
jgi:TRAP-type C4-dicarboxylate transport system permease large subunit